MIYQHGAHSAAGRVTKVGPGVLADPGVLDIARGLERNGKDEQIFSELCELFLHDADTLAPVLLRTMETGDKESVARVAHRLKMSATSICGNRTNYAADALEQQAEVGEQAAIAAAAGVLQQEVDSLRTAIQRFFAARTALQGKVQRGGSAMAELQAASESSLATVSSSA